MAKLTIMIGFSFVYHFLNFALSKSLSMILKKVMPFSDNITEITK